MNDNISARYCEPESPPIVGFVPPSTSVTRRRSVPSTIWTPVAITVVVCVAVLLSVVFFGGSEESHDKTFQRVVAKRTSQANEVARRAATTSSRQQVLPEKMPFVSRSPVELPLAQATREPEQPIQLPPNPNGSETGGVFGEFPVLPTFSKPADPEVPHSKLVREFSGVGKDEHLDTELFEINDDWGFDWQVRGDIVNIVLVDPDGAPRAPADDFMDQIRNLPDEKGRRPAPRPKNTNRAIWWINPEYGGRTGPQSGHFNYHRGGKYSFSVWAVGPWKIKVYQYPNRL